MPTISFVLPTYNERGHIAKFLHEIEAVMKPLKIPYELIVVDDNSPDGTGEHLKEIFKSNPRVRIFIRQNERGLASAILYGINRAQHTHIFLMDTDFNHNPKYLPLFVKLAEYYDIVSGSRYTWGGNMEGGRLRYYGSLLFNYFLAFTLRVKATDQTGGFVLFRKNLLDHMDAKKVFRGYGEFYFRFLYAADRVKLPQKNRVEVIEIPVIYSLRASGKSKTFFSKYLFVYTWEAMRLIFRGSTLIRRP